MLSQHNISQEEKKAYADAKGVHSYLANRSAWIMAIGSLSFGGLGYLASGSTGGLGEYILYAASGGMALKGMKDWFLGYRLNNQNLDDFINRETRIQLR